jgi:hypothetical protein
LTKETGQYLAVLFVVEAQDMPASKSNPSPEDDITAGDYFDQMTLEELTAYQERRRKERIVQLFKTPRRQLSGHQLDLVLDYFIEERKRGNRLDQMTGIGLKLKVAIKEVLLGLANHWE